MTGAVTGMVTQIPAETGRAKKVKEIAENYSNQEKEPREQVHQAWGIQNCMNQREDLEL